MGRLLVLECDFFLQLLKNGRCIERILTSIADITSFCELTSIPLVLNTSFNENEPVVCKPEEALDCFLRTQMDVLVLGNVKISRDKTTKKLPDTTAAQFAPI